MSLRRETVARRRRSVVAALIVGRFGVVALGGGCTYLPPGVPQPIVVDAATHSSAVDPRHIDPSAAADVCLAAARDFEAHGNDAAAIEQYERARSFQPRAKGIARRLGTLYGRTGDRDRAAAEFAVAVKEAPNDAELWNELALFQYGAGELDQAEKSTRHALALDAEHKRAWVNLGLILAERHRDSEALEAFRHAVGDDVARKNLEIIVARRSGRIGETAPRDGDEVPAGITVAQRLTPPSTSETPRVRTQQ